MKIRVECQSEKWFITSIGGQRVKIPFDQAIMKPESSSYWEDCDGLGTLGFEGYIWSIHGIDLSIVEYMPIDMKRAIGLDSLKRKWVPSSKTIRISDGSWEYFAHG